MQPQRSLWKLLIISFFAFLVVACKPIASFSVTPDPVKVGIEATFDASASMADVLPKNNAIKSYAWNFGDGATAAGKTAKHTYATAGTFKVKLTVIDTAGDKGEATESLVVTAGDVVVQTTALKVITQIAGGVSLAGAEVTVGTASGTSDANGLATLGAAPVGENQVVTVKKTGYITQVVRKTLAADTADQQMLVLLMPEKDTLSIAAIESAQIIKSNYLGASVTLPANAFVNAATGAPAVGAATLKLTPWDISGIDLQAMPGNGRALDASGALVDLISAGMMSVEFTDAAGNKLQVAVGKTVDIQMDLPEGTTSIGKNAIAVGTSVPLWNFDEARGLWAGDGVGTVVATSTGLAVRGTVSHFSKWNWAAATDERMTSSILVYCKDANGNSITCSFVAEIKPALVNSGTLGRTFTGGNPYASTSQYNFYRSEDTSTIYWRATNAAGLIGQATTVGGGILEIILEAPKTDNFVECLRELAMPVSCDVSATTTTVGGTTETYKYTVPAGGGRIKTAINVGAPILWSASSRITTNAGGMPVRYEGSTTSAPLADVSITLEREIPLYGKTIRLVCDSTGDLLEYDTRVATFEVASCDVQAALRSADGTILLNQNFPNALGTAVELLLPAAEPNAQLTLHISRLSTIGYGGFSAGEQFSGVYQFADLTENQLFTIRPYLLRAPSPIDN